jgi:hypothetical protein
MKAECVVLYCNEELAKSFIPLVRGHGQRVEVIISEQQCAGVTNGYPDIKVFTPNTVIRVRGFPPQPSGEHNDGNGRNVILLQYHHRDKMQYPEELSRLLSSLTSALTDSGAEQE